jgi:hypothetical protein
MLSERRMHYIRHQATKLFSARGWRKLAKNPRLIAGHLKSFIWDVNLQGDPVKNIDQQAIAALARFSATFNPEELSALDGLMSVKDQDQDTKELADLFQRHGSDKSTHHDYHLIYGPLLSSKREAPMNILEIGLGTNNVDIPSNMGLWGKPGASLRAFRDWAPNAHIFGADVDERILFHDERISTSWVDQTDTKALSQLKLLLDQRRFDLIIDDGLHLPHANFNTLRALLPLLAEDGVYVVEDIEPRHLHYWEITRRVIASRYDSTILAAKGGFLFILKCAL